MDKKRLFLWSLYDFANSIVFINFLLYFSQWLVLDGGLSDLSYNATYAISTVLLLLSAPILAARTDERGGRKYFLNISTIATAASYAVAAILAYAKANIYSIAVFFLLGQYFYQLCFIFYNPMIEEIADSAHRARASGIGQFANALGQVIGIVIMLPLAADSRLAPLIPSVATFVLLAMPMMIFYRENTAKTNINNVIDINRSRTGLLKFKHFFATSISAPLLISFFFYNDALVTVTNNYAIYLERVLGVPDSTKSLLLIAIVIMNGLGAILFGWIGDKAGHLRVIKFILFAWLFVLLATAYTDSIVVLSAMTVLLGLLIGGMWATSRAYLSTLLTSNEMGYGFSYYTLMERCASLVGPLTWGAIISVLGTGSLSYRIAMVAMTAFVLLGLMIISFWKRPHVNATQ